MSYGNYDLKRGDNDGKPCDATPKPPKWGGNTITSSPTTYMCATPTDGAAPTIGLPTHVQDMQADLSELGFLMVGTPDGDFGRGTEWAVREFQIYAKMVQVAKVKDSAKNTAGDAFSADSDNTTDATIPNYSTDYTAGVAAIAASGSTPASAAIPAISKYVDSLESVANGKVYTGRISGVVNEATRDAIEHWLENDYRCPVVIENWSMVSGKRNILLHSNIWKHTDGGWSSRVFTRDFTNYYQYPDSKPQHEYHILGKRAAYKGWKGPQTDNSSVSQLWSEVEVSPEKLIDPNITRTILQNIGPANTASTFRVVRSVSQAECVGNFDSVNAYDRALVSVGLCHWTLGMAPSSGIGQYSDAELCAFLAYLSFSDNPSFMAYFGNFGVRPDKAWNNITIGSLKTYTCWLEVEKEGIEYKEYPRGINNKVGDATWFKSWHWYFRFVTGARTISGVQKGMWGMTRKRISDIRTKEITLQHLTLNISDTPLSDIFTSERANAYLYRWHILQPAGALSTSKLKKVLKNAVNADATLNWSNISNWNDTHEELLVTYLYERLPSVAVSSKDKVKDWNDTILGSLNSARDSFDFDTNNIP